MNLFLRFEGYGFGWIWDALRRLMLTKMRVWLLIFHSFGGRIAGTLWRDDGHRAAIPWSVP